MSAAGGPGRILDLSGVTARYGTVDVLHGVDLHVAEGERVALLGPNGAGKTTLLRAVSRLVATGGTITFGGRDLGPLGPPDVARLGIGHVPSDRGTFTGLSVLENLRLGLSTRRDPAAARRADLDRMLTTFPALAAASGRPAGQLSGGQQQMLALARALLGRPRLLLVDEPSLGLAPLAVRELFATLGDLQATWGLSLLLAEQNARLSLDLADRAYVLAGGRIVLSGPAASLSLDALSSAYLGDTTPRDTTPRDPAAAGRTP